MSSTPPPKLRFSKDWLVWALLPWPAVGAGLFLFRSALLATVGVVAVGYALAADLPLLVILWIWL